jgi:hypothetical protein
MEVRATSFMSIRSPAADGGFLKVWMSHGDQLAAPPPDFHIIGHTKSAPYAAIAHNAKPLYGIQFHPEVTHSPRGKEVISRFVRNICGCKTDWTMVHIYLFIYLSAGPYWGRELTMTFRHRRRSLWGRKSPASAKSAAKRVGL